MFRAPESLVLFSAMLGTGWQLLLLVFAVIVYAMAGKMLLSCFNLSYRRLPYLPYNLVLIYHRGNFFSYIRFIAITVRLCALDLPLFLRYVVRFTAILIIINYIDDC